MARVEGVLVLMGGELTLYQFASEGSIVAVKATASLSKTWRNGGRCLECGVRYSLIDLPSSLLDSEGFTLDDAVKQCADPVGRGTVI